MTAHNGTAKRLMWEIPLVSCAALILCAVAITVSGGSSRHPVPVSEQEAVLTPAPVTVSASAVAAMMRARYGVGFTQVSHITSEDGQTDVFGFTVDGSGDPRTVTVTVTGGDVNAAADDYLTAGY